MAPDRYRLDLYNPHFFVSSARGLPGALCTTPICSRPSYDLLEAKSLLVCAQTRSESEGHKNDEDQNDYSVCEWDGYDGQLFDGPC